MAVASYLFKPMGGIEVKKGETYNHTNIPDSANIIYLTEGVKKAQNVRGVKLRITNNETPPTNPKPNVPILWKEDEPIVFDANYSYTFLDDGVAAYGLREIVT